MWWQPNKNATSPPPGHALRPPSMRLGGEEGSYCTASRARTPSVVRIACRHLRGLAAAALESVAHVLAKSAQLWIGIHQSRAADGAEHFIEIERTSHAIVGRKERCQKARRRRTSCLVSRGRARQWLR